MNLQPRIKIGGVWYTIQLVPHMRLEDDCSGKAIPGRAIIKLDEDSCPQMMLADQIHEIFEIIDIENELKIPHRALQCLATQWFQVLIDNPDVFDSERNREKPI